MNKKLWYKLFRNPRLFFRDYKINKNNKKMFEKYLKNNKGMIQDLKNSKGMIENLKNNKTILETLLVDMQNRDTSNLNDELNLTNPILNFNMEYVLKELNSFNPRGIYIKPLHEELKWVIAVNHRDKTDFIFKFLNFVNTNNINIKYKYKNKIKKLTSISQFGVDINELKSVDIRLSTMRTFPLSLLWFRLEFWNESEEFYLSPTSNHISRKLWKSVAREHNIFYEDKLIDYSCILNEAHAFEATFDIDLVFTWVNSDDEEWQNMFEKYKPFEEEENDASSTSRFLSRDELKYALRSWDRYGSFIRNIYIVSNCKPPKWLDLSKSNLKWVFHEEIMPQHVLPTFSSHAIETSLHKIKGLSNYFIYSNDDVLLVRPSNRNDFFYPNGIVKLKLEPYGNVNGSPDIEHPDYLNAARNAKRLLEMSFSKSTTQLHTHSSQAMRVDVLEKMEREYLTSFEETLNNKFRAITDISVASYMYPHYAYLSGKALPSDIKVLLIQQKHNFKKRLNEILKLSQEKNFRNMPLSVCLNDGGDSHLNEIWNTEIIKFLEILFSEPSQYEL